MRLTTTQTASSAALLLLASLGIIGATKSMPRSRRSLSRQTEKAKPNGPPSDPLRSVRDSFPGSISISLKDGGRLLEFCPDNTCDGFVAKKNVATATLKDFAYLYLFFFSRYTYLQKWRRQEHAQLAAARVLSKSEYRMCKRSTQREEARCVLVDMSRNGKIKLISVTYDEGRRNVVPGDLAKEVDMNPVAQH